MPAATLATPKSKTSVGALIDSLYQLRESKRKLEDEIKGIATQFSALEEQLMEKLDAEGMDKATGKLASVSISSSVAADVEDWETFYGFIKKTGYFHLLERRVSSAAYRELLEAGKKVPGVQPFTKKRLNLRVVA